MSVTPGSYKASAVSLTPVTTKNGDYQIAIELHILEGLFAGQRIVSRIFCNSPESKESAVRILRACGYQGDGSDIDEAALAINTVDVNVAPQRNNPKYMEVFINVPKPKLDPASREKFAQMMRAAFINYGGAPIDKPPF